MAKSEKKKYTKKNITNKIHKSKKNSGTAKKKAFRKSKKVGGLKKGDKPTIETNVNHNKNLFNEEMRKPAKKRNLNNMKKYVDNINKGIAQLKTLEIHYESDTEMVDRVSATNLGFFYEQLKETEEKQAIKPSSSPSSEKHNKKPTKLDPLPPCWKQVFDKNLNRSYVYVHNTDITAGKDHRPPPDYPCPGDEEEALNSTPSTTLRTSNNSKRSSNNSKRSSNNSTQSSNNSKRSSNNSTPTSNSNDFETLLARSKRVKKEAEERQKERARLEQRKKDAEAEAAAAKAERLKLEKAAKEKAAKEKEEEEEKAIKATWSDSDETWQESYRAGK